MVVGNAPQQKDLDQSAQVLVAPGILLSDRQRANARPVPEQARGEHAGVVEHQAIAGPEEAWEVAEDAVLPSPLAAVDDEHTRGGAVLERLLCDAILGQVIIEFRELHGPRQSE